MGLRDNVAGHPVNESDGILNQTGGLFQNRADLPSQLAAPLHIFGGALDHLLGLLGGVVRFGGQIAHFVGHDCEALSAGAGPGGLHRGIQSQDIRLKRNVFNCFNDLADLLVPLQNIGHGIRQRRHLFMAHSHLFASQAGLFLDLGGGLGIFPGCAVDLGYGSGELLHRAGLLRGALCERLRAGGYLLGAGGNLVRGQIDLLKRVTEVAVDVAHGGQDIRIVALVEVIIPRTDIKVPVGPLILIFPCMIMLLMPWALNMEIKNIRLNIVDNDHSAVSQRLVNKIAASTYFHLTEVPASYEEGLRNIELGTADIVMEIPRHLERDWMNGRDAHILVAANSVNGTKGGLGSSYLTAIINGYASELRSERPEAVSVSGIIPSIRIDTQGLFNPNLNYKLYMIPALMAMLLTLICGFLPALNVVSEKEVGTIEQINVTPVPKFTFILAKLLPYWIVGFIVLTLCFVLAWLLYGIVPVGHFSMIYLLVIFFVLVMSGFGLVISNYSATMQQSMFVMFFFMLILMLMSGLFTPVSSMPEWTQAITVFNPLKYFIEAMRMVYLKGSGLVDLLPEIGILSLFAVFFNSWAVISYRKSR